MARRNGRSEQRDVELEAVFEPPGQLPTINIPAKVRFGLYLASAIALLAVGYAVDKSWAGEAEVKLVTGLCALINLLAAARTTREPKSTHPMPIADDDAYDEVSHDLEAYLDHPDGTDGTESSSESDFEGDFGDDAPDLSSPARQPRRRQVEMPQTPQDPSQP